MLIKREVNQNKTRMEKVKFEIMSEIISLDKYWTKTKLVWKVKRNIMLEIISLTNTGPKQN